MPQTRRITYRSLSYYDQQNLLPEFKKEWPEYKELGSQALQATVKRVDYAFSRFFNGLGKYPRYKSIKTYRGWTYPSTAGWKAHTTGDNGYLELSNLGRGLQGAEDASAHSPSQIQMRGKARTWGTPTTCTIIYQNGKWYASITVNCEVDRETGIGAVGLDFGTYHAVAMSDGTIIDNPKLLAKTQEKIKKVSRQLRRKRSPNWNKRIKEKLNLKGMTRKAKGKRKKQKTGLNRNLLDVGIGNLISLIKYKLDEAGGIFVDVPLSIAPSQTCPECGKKKKKELSQRVHDCECGCKLDRDVAAAQVMLNYARGLGTSLLNADDKPLSESAQFCGGFRKVSQMKRQKPRT